MFREDASVTEGSFEKALPSGLHVILGDSAGGIFRRVFHPGDRLLVDRDVLSVGPTPRCNDVASWCEVRRAFWSTLLPDFTEEPTPADPGFVGECERLRGAERVTIWAATGLNEQLFIAHVLHRAEALNVETRKIRLVQFETRRNRPATRVVGTGELNEQLMSEFPDPVSLSAAAIQDYRAAWDALTSPDPTLIEGFGARNPSASTWLKQAMQLLLRHFPDKRTGLSFWDFALLTEVRERGPNAARVIGHTIVNHWDDGDLAGDLTLFARLLRLSDPKLPAPLLEITGDRRNMRGTGVALAPFGLDVLEGRASSYPTNPIDDWVAAVKLSSAQGALWFNEGGRLVRGAPVRQ